ncbi:MAG: hypothetical protein NTW66_02875 [Candidatus Magasanikbacteria bacterium]|nr:hypothetical protein [Candidatus Magasanikbacteria bacterium]
MSINDLKYINDDELDGYSLLGKGTGTSLQHCASMGVRHCKDFLNRVRGYRIEQSDTSEMMYKALKEIGDKREWPMYITVSFYEKK